MLHRSKDLVGDRVVATDGEIGRVDEMYFDDEQWGLRYLVVNTGGWLRGRRVLISPSAIDAAHSSQHALNVDLSRDQVESSPDVDTEKPVSRRYEEAYARHYGYGLYWAPHEGAEGLSTRERAARMDRKLEAAGRDADSSNLRSSAAVIGYAVEARDGTVGRLDDLRVDDETWRVADLVVDTGQWLPGRKICLPPAAVESIDWNARQIRVRLSRDEVARQPSAP